MKACPSHLWISNFSLESGFPPLSQVIANSSLPVNTFLTALWIILIPLCFGSEVHILGVLDYFCYCKACLRHIVDKSFINCINSHMLSPDIPQLGSSKSHVEQKNKQTKNFEKRSTCLWGLFTWRWAGFCLSIELDYACHMRTHAFICSVYSWIGRYYPPVPAWLFTIFLLVFVAFASLWPEYPRETT